ncbi:O-antigen ligase family protein [Bradyrhizobium cajani]|uniref:O-antigen ligase domain-containing protein n=1 Tax=Bradyrhizobium cajani TaxID=1928661 RepID=A0A844T5K6_9BRAD|nr:O-antigen ligase family protein [Bradyrhizobium cajani]MCP3373894.1 O-antigen ligase family protein [Bradyrhizobium cajani]MVT74217.1 O-antigen ligase domain-containing protein [Bradyrhizobium cajani]
MGAISRFFAAAVFVLAPLPLGSLDLAWICFWNFLLVCSLLSADLSAVSRRNAMLLIPTAAAVAMVGVIVMLQMGSGPSAQSAAIWELPRRFFGLALPERLSVTARGPWLAFGSVLLLSLAFVRAVILASDARAARSLLRILALAGCLYALYGILAELIAPDMVLFRQKEAYLGFATGTFVNRNTAATFWGTCALLFLVPLLRTMHRRHEGGPPAQPNWQQRLEQIFATPVALGAGFAICTIALAMTGSRAGLLLSVGAFVLAIVLYLLPLELGRSRKWLVLGGSAAAGLVLLQLVGGIVAGRIVEHGLIDAQRLAAYRASSGMIPDHQLLGVGLGNFEAVFPAIRPAELGSLGIWDRAHSTPLEIAVELGIPAFVVIALVCIWYFYHLFTGSLRRKRDRYIPVVGASVAILGVSHSFIDFSLQIPGYGVFFAAIVGCGLAQSLPSQMRKERGKSAQIELH